jgi:C-terminal processing protease CtpA/Prc
LCQTENKADFNFGFEKITPNQKLPDKYFRWGTVSDYNLSIDSTTKHSGKYSVLIQPSETRNPNTFGCVVSKIPAVYEGKEIELRAWMKLNDVKERPIGLILRIDGASSTLKVDNMVQKNIQGTSDWTMYAVKLPFPEDARTINFGAMLFGTGQIWVDDFELLIDGKDISQAKPREIKIPPAEKDNEFDKGSKIEAFKATEEKINDLKILGMVWGFLKYYHPNIAAGNFNWDYELFRILPKVIQSKDQQGRDAILTDWIKRLGDFEVTREKEVLKNEVKITPDLDWITNSNLAADLTSQLSQVKNAKRKNENYYIGLFKGAGNPEFKNEKPYPTLKYPDVGFRLLSLYRYWNMIQYYFPYRNLIEEDWKNVLKEFVPKYVNASNELEYKLAVLELIGRIHDTHANMQDQTLINYWGKKYAPVKVKFIENKAVVTGFLGSEGLESGLQIGDVLSKIKNKPVEIIVRERLKYTPASNYPTQLRGIATNLLRTNDSTITVEFKRNRKTELREITSYSTAKINIYADPQAQDTCFKLITPDIGYLYPGTIKNVYLPKIMSEVQNTKGLIIDLRCYPSDFLIFDLGKYLMPDSTKVVKWSNGNIINPGYFTMVDADKVGKKNNDYYKGKVIILVNEITVSSAEYHAMAFRFAPGAKVIGSTTAGADGNVSQFYLPGGISTKISGIGVYYPDGKETQRIGIVPDIEIKPTIKGIIEGKDEVLNKAIQIINDDKQTHR